MKYLSFQDDFASYSNDPKGFILPYKNCDPSMYRIYEAAYYRLTNYSVRMTSVRCNTAVYGNCDRTGAPPKW